MFKKGTKGISKIFERYDYIILLVALVINIGLPAFGDMSVFRREFSDFIVIFIVAAGVSLLYSSGRTHMDHIVFILGVGMLVLTVFKFIAGHTVLSPIINLLEVAFMFMLTARLLRVIFRQKQVNSKVVIMSISGYILLGISGGILFYVMSNINPGAFNFNQEGMADKYDFIYFSFVTMSTLGYGDLLPVTSQGKALSILVMLSGVFYTTVVMGTIIGKFVSHSEYYNREKEN